MSFSQRLLTERKRLRFKSKELAEKTGIHAKSQIDYEKDRYPAFLTYLERLADIGFDMGYLLTGIRSGVLINDEETELLSLYRTASPEVRAVTLAALKVGQPGNTKVVTVGRDNNGIISL